jgi:hypothetical protein
VSSSYFICSAVSVCKFVFRVVCPTHHRQFDLGRFVLVPSKRQREFMLEYEKRNFVMREESLAQRGVDPGRTFPQVRESFSMRTC